MQAQPCQVDGVHPYPYVLVLNHSGAGVALSFISLCCMELVYYYHIWPHHHHNLHLQTDATLARAIVEQ